MCPLCQAHPDPGTRQKNKHNSRFVKHLKTVSHSFTKTNTYIYWASTTIKLTVGASMECRVKADSFLVLIDTVSGVKEQ